MEEIVCWRRLISTDKTRALYFDYVHSNARDHKGWGALGRSTVLCM